MRRLCKSHLARSLENGRLQISCVVKKETLHQFFKNSQTKGKSGTNSDAATKRGILRIVQNLGIKIVFVLHLIDCKIGHFLSAIYLKKKSLKRFKWSAIKTGIVKILQIWSVCAHFREMLDNNAIQKPARRMRGGDDKKSK